LIQLELVQNCYPLENLDSDETCFARCVKTEHEDSHLSIGKEFVHDSADGATHLGGSTGSCV
jgi:hypothetical protein